MTFGRTPVPVRAGVRPALQSASGDVMTPGKSQGHQPSRAEERTIREAALDETIEASFPASDPPSSIPNPEDHDAVVRVPRSPTAAASPSRK